MILVTGATGLSGSAGKSSLGGTMAFNSTEHLSPLRQRLSSRNLILLDGTWPLSFGESVWENPYA